MSEHYKKLERMYLAGPINDLFKPTIVVGDRTSEISIEVNPQFFHAANALHGSVYFKMLDDAAFFAANSIVEDVFVLTGHFEIKLLRPVTGGELIATGRVTNEGEKIEASAELKNDQGKLVAVGKGLFVRSKLALNELESYKN